MKKWHQHIIYILLIILIITTINAIFYFSENNTLPAVSKVLNFLGWAMFFTIPLYLVNAPIIIEVQKRIPGFKLKDIIRKFIFGVLSSAIVTLITGSILYIVMLVLGGFSIQESIDWLFSSDSAKSLQFLIWIAMSIAVIFQVVSIIQYFQSDQLKEEKQRVIAISAEHESLKSQIGPHFLFNSLNVLNGLIDENPEKAQDFVSELSTVYRYVLDQKDKSLVPLTEELDFAKTYLNLIQMRYEDGLEFEWPDDISETQMIVPLSLQILLENCIKHNRISSVEPLIIKVSIENNYLTVSNNLQIKKQFTNKTGKGLNSIVSRYNSLTKREVVIDQNQKEFKVEIPLITEKEIKMEINQKYTEQEYLDARKRVEDIQKFYRNLATYIVCIIFFVILDWFDNHRFDWFFWPALGWGIGVTIHGLKVFSPFNSNRWKDKMIQKELEKRKNDYHNYKSN